MLARGADNSEGSAARAARQRRYRRRQRCGEMVVTLTLPEHAVAAALLATGRLTPAQALDRSQVGRAIGDMVSEWAREWAK